MASHLADCPEEEAANQVVPAVVAQRRLLEVAVYRWLHSENFPGCADFRRAHEHVDFGEFHCELRGQFARRCCLCRLCEDDGSFVCIVDMIAHYRYLVCHTLKSFPACVWPHRSLVYLIDLMVTAAPTGNNVKVMAELAGEMKQGLAMFFFLELFRQAGHATAWRSCNIGTLSIERVEEIFTSQVSELIDVSAITAEVVDAKPVSKSHQLQGREPLMASQVPTCLVATLVSQCSRRSAAYQL